MLYLFTFALALNGALGGYCMSLLVLSYTQLSLHIQGSYAAYMALCTFVFVAVGCIIFLHVS